MAAPLPPPLCRPTFKSCGSSSDNETGVASSLLARRCFPSSGLPFHLDGTILLGCCPGCQGKTESSLRPSKDPAAFLRSTLPHRVLGLKSVRGVSTASSWRHLSTRCATVSSPLTPQTHTLAATPTAAEPLPGTTSESKPGAASLKRCWILSMVWASSRSACRSRSSSISSSRASSSASRAASCSAASLSSCA